MERDLKGLKWKSLLLYLDDVTLYTPSFGSHVERLEELLQRLRTTGLKLKPNKC